MRDRLAPAPIVAGMRRTPPPPDPPASAPMATLPGQLQPLWALAVAVAESAAEIAASRPIASWRASASLYAAADQAWGPDGGGGPGGWRTDRTGSGGEFRFAVLLVDGAHDLRPRWPVDSLERALPATRRVVLDGAGHLPWVEAPSAFRAAVAGFLNERFS